MNLCREKINCVDRSFERRVYQKQNYFVFENFYRAAHAPLNCAETVTLVTTADYPELGYLTALAKRWMAPISVALHCARKDYQTCLDSLIFLGTCLPKDSDRYFFRRFVSVHLFFDEGKLPDNVSYWITRTVTSHNMSTFTLFIYLGIDLQNPSKHHLGLQRESLGQTEDTLKTQ